jgi:hypothetical protein
MVFRNYCGYVPNYTAAHTGKQYGFNFQRRANSRSHIMFAFLTYVPFFPVAQQPPVGQGPLIIEASRSHSDTPHSVGLLWSSDQPDAETSTWQHTTFTRDRHPCPQRDSNPQSQEQEAVGPRLGPRDHWLRHLNAIFMNKITRFKDTRQPGRSVLFHVPLCGVIVYRRFGVSSLCSGHRNIVFPEDGSSIFFRKVGRVLPRCITPHPRGRLCL